MNLEMQNFYLIKPDGNGGRDDTKLAVEYSDEQIAEFIEQGYFLIGNQEFQKLIGNAGIAYSIAADGTLYETPPYVPPLEEVQEAKIAELKAERDRLEVEPIEYDYHFFDYDEKARDRINAAIMALDLQGEGATIAWTTADNDDVDVTANDLRGVVACVAARSNLLHIQYRQLKEMVNACTTVEEVEEIRWESV